MNEFKFVRVVLFLVIIFFALSDILHTTPPTVSIAAVPITIKLGESSVLNWTSSGATSACINNNIGNVAVNGSRTVKPLQTTTYTITLSGSGGSATASVTLTVVQPLLTVSFTVSPTTIREGESAMLSWKSVNATSASIDNGIGSVVITGTQLVNPLITTIYKITVSGNGETNSVSVTLSVENKPKCYAYIPNTLDGNVMVLDTKTNQVVATILVGTEPRGVVVSPDGTCVYISQKDEIAVINMNSNSITGIIPIPGCSKYIAVHPRGHCLYTSCSRLENGIWRYLLAVVDPVSKQVLREIPFLDMIRGIVVQPDGNRIFVCNYEGNKISIVDATTYMIVTSLAIDLPLDLRFKSDGSRFYVIHDYGGNQTNFSVVDTSTFSVLAQLRLPESSGVTASPFALGLQPDGSRVYITHSDDRFSVIDTATNKLIGTFSVVGYAPEALSILPDGGKLYIICTNSNWLRVFNTSGYSGLATVNLGRSPRGYGNFTGFPTTAISGKVTREGTSVEGVSVDFSGEAFSRTVQTDAHGKYILAVKNGIFTLTPSKSGLAFYPQQIRLTVNGTVTGQDFTVLNTNVPPKVGIAATPASILMGESATLVWTVTNANSVSLDNGIGAVPLSGTLAVYPVQTTTYTVLATQSVLTSSASVTVTVTYPVPTVKLIAFPTTIMPGGTSTLTWTSTGVDSASIDNGIGNVPLNGSHAITPTKTTTYKITVKGQGGTASAITKVTIKYPVPTVIINAVPDSIPPGGSSALSWTSTNATMASINNGVGSVPVSGTRVVFPKIDTTYTIIMTGQGGTAQASVTIKMLDALLKRIWNSMKTAMIGKNIEGVASYFSEITKTRYKNLYMTISAQLPQIAQGMGAIGYLGFEGDVAVYGIKRKDIVDGQEQEIFFRIYFIFENGKWVIYKY